MAKRRKQRGHFCWCCERTRSNEQFSGRGRARHLCKECSKLPPEDLAFRQEVRNIERMLDGNGRVRRTQRKSFERMLLHSNERVRRYAEEVRARAEAEREAEREAEDREREAYELAWLEVEALPWLAGFDVDDASCTGAPDDVFE